MKIWGIKNCNSVKKALDYLDHKGLKYEFIDYKKNPPSIETLKNWVEKSGIESVFNHKSATYKKLNLHNQSLTLEQKIKLMNENPTLIKRPVLEYGKVLQFGFSKEAYEAIF